MKEETKTTTHTKKNNKTNKQN